MGRRIDYYDDPSAPKATSMVPSVNVIVTDDQDRILLIRRTDNDNWALPGGAIDLSESVARAAVRETLEESGIKMRCMACRRSVVRIHLALPRSRVGFELEIDFLRIEQTKYSSRPGICPRSLPPCHAEVCRRCTPPSGVAPCESSQYAGLRCAGFGRDGRRGHSHGIDQKTEQAIGRCPASTVRDP